ncbi:MAG: SRPBCC domain-containing protein [Polyangiaceae bacterium]|nr:SRPBCC domain-containing protein [Polyangiaceae bacterium]
MKKLVVTADVPTEIKMTRTLDAPRRLVEQAMTRPELLTRWLGNSYSPLVSAEVEFRVGGAYRHVYRRSGDHVEFAFVGTYREIGDGRWVTVERMEGAPGEAVITTTLVETRVDGVTKTTLTAVMAFPTQQVRDMVLATGMEKGAAESYDNLERLVTSL